MNILVLKLVTGEEVLGELDNELENSVILKNPVGISIVRGRDGSPNVGFSPFPLHSEQEKDSKIMLDKSHVVYYYTPAKDFRDNYEQLFGSGLVLPPTKTLITG